MSEPSYTIGTNIASDTFMGTIISGFFVKNEWHYNIGENVSVNEETEQGYISTKKYIAESDVYWYELDNIWLPTVKR